MGEIIRGFEPFAPDGAKVLILGSFPSVKSRSAQFYYGNPQNAFWKIMAEFFNESPPKTLEEKKLLLSRRQIALWDIVTECEIVGSKDATIKNYRVADLSQFLQNSEISLIIINGGKAYEIFLKNYKDLKIPYVGLPSTSPANTRLDKEKWFNALRRAFM